MDEVRGLTAITLDKLSAIRGDLVRSDGDWESWDLDKLAEALRLCIRRNLTGLGCEDEQATRRRDRERMFLTNKGDKPRGCVYCESGEHKGVECNKVTTCAERKQILARKKLCFN